MKYVLFILTFSISHLLAEYFIVFVHIGPNIPLYADTAITQARLFNPDARIIMLSSSYALERLEALKDQENIELYAYEDLPKSSSHLAYDERCSETSPFWRYTSERFLYLWDLIEAYGLENIFHLENDNMLYSDLEPMLANFQHHYPGIGATFDNDGRCIPGFVWIANGKAMHPLADYFAQRAPEALFDMQVIASYRQVFGSPYIDPLPIIMPQYATVHPLESPHHHTTSMPEVYSNHAETFDAIFDAAAIGQYLGGIDPIHENNGPGFINESCLFNPSHLDYQWLVDEKGRLIPYAIFQDHFYKIINLHIHSKRLPAFKS